MSKLKSFFGISDEEEYDEKEITDNEVEAEVEKLRKFSRSESLDPNQPSYLKRDNTDKSRTAYTYGSKEIKVVVIENVSLENCPTLVDNLKRREPVIVNFANIESVEANKIFQFLNGAVYALDGHTKEISKEIFMFARRNIRFEESDEEEAAGNFFSRTSL